MSNSVTVTPKRGRGRPKMDCTDATCNRGYHSCMRWKKYKGNLKKDPVCRLCLSHGLDARFRPVKLSENVAFTPIRSGNVNTREVFKDIIKEKGIIVNKDGDSMNFLEIGDLAFRLKLEMEKKALSKRRRKK